ncbi:MCE family protein [Gordonia sp. i37]|uniref:MCE family protein n=1 Tax=Gordonia sp. i37 TaxID=1961707 RepID=UPI0009AE694F|nr:MCE family protein [Gordonia sp. i37]OPX16591.1 mammalian cell entry protein [Gordonia sp. i37]
MIDWRKSMGERNPITIGIIGTLIIIAILVLAFNYRSLSFLGGDREYHAQFGDASGLNVGDPVQLAGIEVGTVKAIDIDGAHVTVDFGVNKDARQRMGDQTGAAIKVKTLLGQRYVDILPSGSGTLQPGSTIGLDRTSWGYDIARDLDEVTGKVTDTDKTQLTDALNQLSTVQEALPDNLKQTIDGVARLSRTIGSRDESMSQLLASSAGVSQILADRNLQLTAMFGQGQTLFAALNSRSEAIHAILVQTTELSTSLNTLDGQIKQILAPTLDRLGRGIDLLNKNYDNVNQAISGMKTFTYQLGDAVGSGPFFNVLLQNIIPANTRLGGAPTGGQR